MPAHPKRTTVTEDQEIQATLPAAPAPGEAEVYADAAAREARPGDSPANDLNSWLNDTLRRLPQGPSPPLEALRRENLYEDD